MTCSPFCISYAPLSGITPPSCIFPFTRFRRGLACLAAAEELRVAAPRIAPARSLLTPDLDAIDFWTALKPGCAFDMKLLLNNFSCGICWIIFSTGTIPEVVQLFVVPARCRTSRFFKNGVGLRFGYEFFLDQSKKNCSPTTPLFVERKAVSVKPEC